MGEHVERVPLTFRHSRDAGLHLWHFAPAVVVRSDGPKHPVLTERHWPGAIHLDLTEPGSPMHEFGGTGGQFVKAAAYLGLAFRLTRHLERWVQPTWCVREAAGALGREPELVSWEFAMEIPADGSPCRPLGFVEARGRGPAWAEGAREESALFPVRTFRELAAVQLALSGDASSELAVFGLAPSRSARVLDILRGPRAPQLAALLLPGEVFVDVVVGSDLGYPDSVLVASQDDLSERLEALRAETVEGLARFEAEAEGVRDLPQYLALLDAIAFGSEPPTEEERGPQLPCCGPDVT